MLGRKIELDWMERGVDLKEDSRDWKERGVGLEERKSRLERNVGWVETAELRVVWLNKEQRTLEVRQSRLERVTWVERGTGRKNSE